MFRLFYYVSTLQHKRGCVLALSKAPVDAMFFLHAYHTVVKF